MRSILTNPLGARARRDTRAVLAAALTALLASLALAPAQVAVEDDLGREVRLVDPAQRVVTMIPTHTETVCALDACDLLVGRDTFSNHPPSVTELPDLGSAFSPDLEALVALEPDLVLTDEYSGMASSLDDVSVPAYAGTAQTLEDVWRTTRQVGTLLGRDEEAADLITAAQARVAALTARVEGRPGPSVFVELDATPYSVGETSYLGRLLTLAGGDNVVPAELGEFPQVDPELVIEADPEVILLADAPHGESADTVADRPGWGQLRAVREGRVIELTQAQVDLLTRAGPRLPDALALLIELLHPDLD
ncbi:MAG: ABC transporter substrate-binding protein [Trueperaceae bacterium]|nr:ABC transporter substrate-binding protein [Trueperaceae bacterium]